MCPGQKTTCGPLHCPPSLNLCLSPTLTLSDSNTPNSLLARSPDHSCTFSQPPFDTLTTHPHYITHRHTRLYSSTLPTSSLLPSMCHWLLLSYRPPPRFFLRPMKAFTVALTDTPLCQSSLFLVYDSLFMALLCPCLHLSVHSFLCFDSIFLFYQMQCLFAFLIPPILQRRCNY